MTEGILNDAEQPVAIEDTTTTEQESVVPYPVINTVDTHSETDFQIPIEPGEAYEKLISIKMLFSNKGRVFSIIDFDKEKLKTLTQNQKVLLLEHIENSCKHFEDIINLIDPKTEKKTGPKQY